VVVLPVPEVMLLTALDPPVPFAEVWSPLPLSTLTALLLAS
jgi:hypothetical protein